MSYACGEVGLREEEFYQPLTWNQYQHRVNHHLLSEWREWDRTRRIACEMFNNMNDKPVTYEQYMPLPTDEPESARRARQVAANDAFLDEMRRKGRI